MKSQTKPNRTRVFQYRSFEEQFSIECDLWTLFSLTKSELRGPWKFSLLSATLKLEAGGSAC